MFCFQCEQTAKGEGCTKIGVCGKQPDVAALQDMLIYMVKGLSQVATAARNAGKTVDPAINAFTCEAIFSTLTNVDFDPARFVALIREAAAHRDALKAQIGAVPEGPATVVPRKRSGRVGCTG
jgi:hydroxylamine reductase